MKNYIFLGTFLTLFFVATANGENLTVLDIRKHNGICEVRTLLSQGKGVVGRFIYRGHGEWYAQNTNDLKNNSLRNLGDGPVKGLYEHLSKAGSFGSFNRITEIYHNHRSVKVISEGSQKPTIALVSKSASRFTASHGISLISGSAPVELFGTACHLFWRALESDEVITSYGLIPDKYNSRVRDEITAMLFLENVIFPNAKIIDYEKVRRVLTSN